MKKLVAIVLVGMFVLLSSYSFAEQDYSFLEGMTTEELVALQVEIGKRIASTKPFPEEYIGHWVLYDAEEFVSDDEGNQIEELTIDENGTLTINDNTYQLQNEYAGIYTTENGEYSIDHAGLSIFDENDQQCDFNGISCCRNTEEEFAMFFSVDDIELIRQYQSDSSDDEEEEVSAYDEGDDSDEEEEVSAYNEGDDSDEEEEVEEPSSSVIDMTLENWRDYFEITDRTVCKYNDFNEMLSAQKRYYLVLKEEYQDRIDPAGENSFTFEISYDHAWYYCEYNADTQEIIPNKKMENSVNFKEYLGYDWTFTQPSERGSQIGKVKFQSGYLPDDKTLYADISGLFEESGSMIDLGVLTNDGYVVRILENFEIERIEGSISLYD